MQPQGLFLRRDAMGFGGTDTLLLKEEIIKEAGVYAAFFPLKNG
ncbi:hypothetical protein MED217_14960 [Leeuwenhoekiella blandensis MED217]|uniref:Uncharacterized protein n=1 Tax=Leeuwenhoekiella blandensis (strain CECT 7118 / CCUG 51940 / KCTC 22103 / MED217) TaxID=398720 RepID=A3XG98_LEEBM|nr:hypothetical protein MED217_14960 [Leeuwenhoekiella blandensis MED217]